jgi:hypothetical protein
VTPHCSGKDSLQDIPAERDTNVTKGSNIMLQHPALPEKSGFALCAITFLLSLGLFADSAAETAPADHSGHRFFVGYERGLSFRYFPARLWGFGLVATTSGALYEKDYDRLGYDYDNETYSNTSREKSKNISLYFDIIRNIKSNGHFTLAAFASTGGSYQTQKRSDVIYSRYYVSSVDSIIIRDFDSQTETRRWGIIGRVGILPGFTWGAFSAQFRFGLEGRYSFLDSPANREDSGGSREQVSNGKTTTLNFIRPANLVESLILHLEI